MAWPVEPIIHKRLRARCVVTQGGKGGLRQHGARFPDRGKQAGEEGGNACRIKECWQHCFGGNDLIA
jgi:hypothetical protein